MSDVLPIRTQPRPVAMQVGYIRQGGAPDGIVVATAISRQWAPEDVPFCRLCPAGSCRINRTGNNCLTVVNRHIPYGDAILYDERQAYGAPVVGSTSTTTPRFG